MTILQIPNNVTIVNNYAFYDCDSLTSVTIGNCIEKICMYAFSHCNNITDVYYNGSKEQWNQIEIELHNEPLMSATIHFNSNKTFTITYDANGGVGAPSSQTKTEGVDLTLSSTKPTRSGYMFRGWTTGLLASDTPKYQPGSVYTADADITLYAVWKKEFYGDIYNDGVINQGDVLFASQVVEGLKNASSYAVFLGDVNGDGILTSDDVNLISQYNTKMIHSFPVEKMHTVMEVYRKPYKTVFKPGTSIDTTGLQLAVLYYDSAVSTIYKSYHILDCGYKINPTVTSGSGDQNITVSVGDLKTAYSIILDSEIPTKGSASLYYENPEGTVLNITLCDNYALDGYYWGSDITIENNNFNYVANKTKVTISKSISQEGSYYFAIKDIAGNLSYAYKYKFFRLTFDANKGNVNKEIYYVLNNDIIKLPYATRSGHTFKGWSTSNSSTEAEYLAEDFYNVTSSETLYAVWEENHNHSYTSNVTTAATCKNEGVRTYKCNNCTASYTEAIAKNANNHTGGTEVKNAESATCTAEGYTGDTYCKGCDKKLSSGEAIKALGHNKVNHEGKKATCTKSGWAAYVTCSRCDYTTYSEISSTGHTFTEKIIDSAHLVSKATTESPAVYKYDCVNCDAISEDLTFTHGEKLPVTLGTTKKLTATQTTSSATLTWSAVDGANIYRVYRKNGDSWKKICDTTKLTNTIKSLKAGTKYSFAVKAGIKNGDTINWAIKYATINTATKAIATSKVTATQTTSSIKLSWNKVAGATGYRIYYKSGNSWKVTVSSTTATSHTFKNLKAGAKFTFAIRPYIKTDSGVVWSAYTQFTTATKPSTVTAKVTSNTKGKIILNWNKANGAELYQVYYKTGNGKFKLYKTYTNPGTLNFKNLKSGTKYTFAVRAVIKTDGGNIRSGYKAVSATVK